MYAEWYIIFISCVHTPFKNVNWRIYCLCDLCERNSWNAPSEIWSRIPNVYTLENSFLLIIVLLFHSIELTSVPTTHFIYEARVTFASKFGRIQINLFIPFFNNNCYFLARLVLKVYFEILFEPSTLKEQQRYTRPAVLSYSAQIIKFLEIQFTLNSHIRETTCPILPIFNIEMDDSK